MSDRAHCYRCDKPRAFCLCAFIPRVDNVTPVTIVQHARERRHPFGTARIARLGLSRCEVQAESRVRLPPGATLLFPDPGVPTLEATPPTDRPRHLVAIDGTWSHAAQLRRRHPALAALPAVRLAPGAPSRYRVRREPSVEAISTLEAIVHALGVIEPETGGFDALLTSFDRMQDMHFARRGENPCTPRHRARPREATPLPAALRGDGGDVVRLYAELHQPRGQKHVFPIRVTAARADGGGRLDALVRGPIRPSVERVANMGLGATDALDAVTPAELNARLAALIAPGDTVVAWSQRAERVPRPPGVPFLSLKHYCAPRLGGRLGTLRALVARLGLESGSPWAPGRAGPQMAHLDSMLAWLRSRE